MFFLRQLSVEFWALGISCYLKQQCVNFPDGLCSVCPTETEEEVMCVGAIQCSALAPPSLVGLISLSF